MSIPKLRVIYTLFTIRRRKLVLKTALIPILSVAALTLSGSLVAETPNPEDQAAAPEAQPITPPPPPAQVEAAPPAQVEAAPPAQVEAAPPAQVEAAPPAQVEAAPPAQVEAAPPAEVEAAPAPSVQAEHTTTSQAQAPAPEVGGAPSPFVHQADALLKQMQAMQEYMVKQHEAMRKQAEEQLDYLKSHQDELFKDAVDRQTKLAEYYEDKRKQAQEEQAKLEKHRDKLLNEALEQQTTLAERQEKMRKQAEEKLTALKAERERLSTLSQEEIQAMITKWREAMRGAMGQGEQMTARTTPRAQQPGFSAPIYFGAPQFGPERGFPGGQGFGPGSMPGQAQAPFFGPSQRFGHQAPMGQGPGGAMMGSQPNPMMQGGPAANLPGPSGQGSGFRSPQGFGTTPGFGPQGRPGINTGPGYPGRGMGQGFRGPEMGPSMMDPPFGYRGRFDPGQGSGFGTGPQGRPGQGMQPYQWGHMPTSMCNTPGQGSGSGFGAQRGEARDTAPERRVRSRQSREAYRAAAQRRHEDAWARHEQRRCERSSRLMDRHHAWAPERWINRDAPAGPEAAASTPSDITPAPSQHHDATRWLQNSDSSRHPMRSWRT
jgi:chemotaxis protein histidine kinase CheA